MSLVGSRRFSRGVVRKVAQSRWVAETVTAAPSFSPRLSSQLPFAARRV
jgi:hypothetical protein